MPGKLPLLMPMCACRTVWRTEVNIGKKQFLLRGKSAFALACSVHIFLLCHVKAVIATAVAFVSSPSLKAWGFPQRSFDDPQEDEQSIASWGAGLQPEEARGFFPHLDIVKYKKD